MLDDVSFSDATARLRAALSNHALPHTQRAFAEALAERLENGVRVVLLGPRGVGKSALCDAMLGASSAAAPGDQTRHFYIDGSHGQAPELGVAVPSFSLGFCMLGHVQILDVGCPAEMPSSTVMLKALEYADIVLWCTQDFTQEEAEIWSKASDELKDRSFLVLTQADTLARQGHLDTRIQALQTIVEQEFHSLLPTTTSQVLQLSAAGHKVSAAQLAASGVKALVDAVKGIVLSGQRADLDSALLFLERHGVSELSTPRSESVSPVTVAKSEDSAVSTVTKHKNSAVTFNAARSTIMARAYDLAEMGFDANDGDMTEVLELCGTIAEELTDVMHDQGQKDPELSPWCAAFQDASDKVMLMGLENDTRSAADAVTILLQLRRDLESLQVS